MANTNELSMRPEPEKRFGLWRWAFLGLMFAVCYVVFCTPTGLLFNNRPKDVPVTQRQEQVIASPKTGPAQVEPTKPAGPKQDKSDIDYFVAADGYEILLAGATAIKAPNAQGKTVWKIQVMWVNAGKRQVRRLMAKVIAYDSNGQIIQLPSSGRMTLFHVKNDVQGVLQFTAPELNANDGIELPRPDPNHLYSRFVVVPDFVSEFAIGDLSVLKPGDLDAREFTPDEQKLWDERMPGVRAKP